MAFADNISLNDNTPTSRSFNKTGNPGKPGVRRLDSSTSLAAPRWMDVRHQVVPNGTGGIGIVDRHNVVFSKTLVGTDLKPRTASITSTLVVPRHPDFTTAEVLHLVAFMKNFLDATNVPKLLVGEE